VGTTAKVGLVLAMVALLVTGQLVEREFRRRREQRELPALAYPELLKPLEDARLPSRPSGRAHGAEGTRPGAAPAIASGSARDAYTIQAGDTLAKIAKKVYGAESAWKTIYERNRGLIPDPARLQVGAVLQIPPREKPAAR
jgi:nucleoid-associated protein YgaU